MEETKAVGRLPNLDIEITHRQAPDGQAEFISLTLKATPSFAAVGELLTGRGNPFLPPFGNPFLPAGHRAGTPEAGAGLFGSPAAGLTGLFGSQAAGRNGLFNGPAAGLTGALALWRQWAHLWWAPWLAGSGWAGTLAAAQAPAAGQAAAARVVGSGRSAGATGDA